MQVCRQFCDLIDHTSSLQLVIEMGAAGYDWSRLPTSLDALEKFRSVQRIWRNPQPRRLEHTIDLRPFGPQQDGTRAMPVRWALNGDLCIIPSIDEIGGNTRLEFFWLGTGTAGGAHPLYAKTTRKRYHSLELGGRWSVTFVDVAQDLLVLRNGQTLALWFYSIETGEIHRRAMKEGCGEMAGTAVTNLSGDWILGDLHVEGKQKFYLVHWPTYVSKVSAFARPSMRNYEPPC